jgi:hypothetical protein
VTQQVMRMTSLDDDGFAERLGAVAIDPVEAHATLAGFLCAGGDPDVLDDAELDVLLPDVDGGLARRLLAALDASLRSLDYTFQPLAGDDELPLPERLDALTRWCGAFLSGYGTVDTPPLLDDDCRELVRDLAMISAGAVVDGDDEPVEGAPDGRIRDETAFAEVHEYVRVAVLTLHGNADEHARRSGA